VRSDNDIRILKSSSQLWDDARAILEKKLAQPSFESWIKPVKLLMLEDREVVLAVQNDFMRTMVTNYKTQILSAFQELLDTSEPLSMRVEIQQDLEPSTYTSSIANIQPEAASQSSPTKVTSVSIASAPKPPPRSDSAVLSALNPRFTFANFVVGSNSRFCHSAAHAVAQKPGQAYNPLFMYGGVGLGKTHIMQAIGHEIIATSPHLQVRYISCERFTNDLVSSIREDRMVDFRRRYRQVDVLLVDDIQFIEGKDATQEEFFHTFNALRDSGKQVVLSSDRPPKALAHLTERLRSRFEWGLIADIQLPDLETRIAILQKKAILEQMTVDNDVLEFIATTSTKNIREMEGALISAYAFSNLMGAPMDLSTVQSALQRGGAPVKKSILSLEVIINAVAEAYKVEPSELRSSKRSQDITLARHVAMYLAHEIGKFSYPRIGETFGNRKHTSILYAYQRIQKLITEDPELASMVSTISKKLGF
jgi:chromosomal replication initiator protein